MIKLIIIILIKLKKSQNILKKKYLKKLNENSDIYSPSYNSKEDIKDKQSQNIKLILSTLSVFHLDISGNDYNDEQLLNI